MLSYCTCIYFSHGELSYRQRIFSYFRTSTCLIEGYSQTKSIKILVNNIQSPWRKRRKLTISGRVVTQNLVVVQFLVTQKQEATPFIIPINAKTLNFFELMSWLVFLEIISLEIFSIHLKDNLYKYVLV